MSRGEEPLTVQPTELHVPSISFTVPERVRAIERSRMVRAISITWSSVMLPSCLMFFTCYEIIKKAKNQVTSQRHVPKVKVLDKSSP